MTVGGYSSFISGRSCVISAATQVISLSPSLTPWVKVTEADFLWKTVPLGSLLSVSSLLSYRMSLDLKLSFNKHQSSNCVLKKPWLANFSINALFIPSPEQYGQSSYQMPPSDMHICKVNDQKAEQCHYVIIKIMIHYCISPNFLCIPNLRG